MLKIIELFGGIGACSKALTNLKIPYEIIDYVEIDKCAVKSFNAIHNTNFEPKDITKWGGGEPNVDLLFHGSPCTNISVAGKQQGADNRSGTASSLLYNSIQAIGRLRPKIVVWENVKNLLSEKHKHNFDNYINTLNCLGYKSYYDVLNAKEFGLPQNRERVFTVSIRDDLNKKFEFPIGIKKSKLSDFIHLEKEKLYVEFDFIEHTNFYNFKRKKDNSFINGSYNRVWKIENFVGTIPTQANIIKVGKVEKGCLKYRTLTAKEALILMGFTSLDYELIKNVNKDNIIYKQAGNSICVPVIEEIFKKLFC